MVVETAAAVRVAVKMAAAVKVAEGAVVVVERVVMAALEKEVEETVVVATGSFSLGTLNVSRRSLLNGRATREHSMRHPVASESKHLHQTSGSPARSNVLQKGMSRKWAAFQCIRCLLPPPSTSNRLWHAWSEVK